MNKQTDEQTKTKNEFSIFGIKRLTDRSDWQLIET
jgi:hypothetical protein